MTIDDDNSVYVGGLGYDATEESVRRVFDLYGHVAAVKIVNDRGIGGKCYGFVTFTNPRAAVNAINDMNGRSIDGRVVRVNEVKTRFGRSDFRRESFRRNSARGDWDRGRDHDNDSDLEDRYGDRNRDRSRGRDLDRHRDYDRVRGHEQTRDDFMDSDRDRNQDRDAENNEQEHDRMGDQKWKKDREFDGSRDRVVQRMNDHHRTGDKDKAQTSKKMNGSDLSDGHGREHSSELSDDDHDGEVKQLGISNHQLEELRNQVSQMEKLAEEKQEVVTKLQEKYQKLEDALTAAKKTSSHRQMQLTKLHRCFLHVKEYNERLKGSEEELQSLVDATTIDTGVNHDVGGRG
ncbi:hypothetical protein U1Q18_028510 [Sarracenia purpurea var. burkii]